MWYFITLVTILINTVFIPTSELEYFNKNIFRIWADEILGCNLFDMFSHSPSLQYVLSVMVKWLVDWDMVASILFFTLIITNNYLSIIYCIKFKQIPWCPYSGTFHMYASLAYFCEFHIQQNGRPNAEVIRKHRIKERYIKN